MAADWGPFVKALPDYLSDVLGDAGAEQRILAAFGLVYVAEGTTEEGIARIEGLQGWRSRGCRHGTVAS